MADENERSICKITIARMLLGLSELLMVMEKPDGLQNPQVDVLIARLDNELRGIKEQRDDPGRLPTGVYRRPTTGQDFV